MTTAFVCGALVGGVLPASVLVATSARAQAPQAPAESRDQTPADRLGIRIPAPLSNPAPPTTTAPLVNAPTVQRPTVNAPPRPAPTPEQAALRGQIDTYMKRPAVTAGVQEIIKRHVSFVPGICNGMKFDRTAVVIAQKPEFDAEGAMRAGAFRQSFTGGGCGTRKPVINVWVGPEANGAPTLKASFPGTSIADPRLQADFTQVAMANAALAIKDCKTFQVIDTRFAGFEGTSPSATAAGRDARMWKEEWLLRGCGKGAVVVMHFQPDATGTAGRSTPTETRVLTPSAPAAPGAIPPAGTVRPTPTPSPTAPRQTPL